MLDLDTAGAVVETVRRVCGLGRYVAYLADDCELTVLVGARHYGEIPTYLGERFAVDLEAVGVAARGVRLGVQQLLDGDRAE